MAVESSLASIAAALRDWLAPTGWLVHTGRRTRGDQRGGAIVPFLGVYFTTGTALSQIDLMAARPDREIPLIVETVRRPVPPDRILGIAANVLLADAVRYRDETYAIADTTLIIAAVVGSRGQARLRLAALEDRLNWLSEALRRQGKPRLTSIRLATSDSVESLPGVVLAEAKHVVKLPRR